MRAFFLRSVVLGALGLWAFACSPRTVDYKVKVITSACVAPSPFDGATHLRFRVTGEGIATPLLMVASVSDAQQEIPEIPAGKQRVLEVRAYKGDPNAGGQVISVGSSLPFDVPDVVPSDAAPTEIAVFLRRVNAFTPPSTAEAPTTCARLREARAGHTATLLKDGRVLIAGGYELVGATQKVTATTTEIFDPGKGSFEPGPDLGYFSGQGLFSPAHRHFHSSTLLPNGQVLLAGGEASSDKSTFPVKTALIYDPTVNQFGILPLLNARVQPGIATDASGRVLIVGGRAADGTPVAQPEWYDPTRAPYAVRGDTPTPDELARQNPKPVNFQLPRVGMSVGAVQGGQFIAVAGGSNGTALTDEIVFFNFDGTTFSASPATIRLQQARVGAGMATFQDANKLMVVGGYSSMAEPVSAVSTSEVIATGNQFSVSEGGVIAPRGDACVAALKDGRVLAIGGRTSDGFATAQSAAFVEMITPVATGGPPTVIAMPDVPPVTPQGAPGRYFHTCTTLHDGSVLVSGGVEEVNGTTRVLQDAYIFTPAPLD